MVIATLSATELPILSAHALKAGGWDSPNRDPFDRVLAAQAHVENLPLLSVDKAMRTFDISLIAE